MIAHTVKGKGFLSWKTKPNGILGPLSLDEMAQAFMELDAAAEVVKASD